MRNSFDAEPRLMALTEADIAAQRRSLRTWMPESPSFARCSIRLAGRPARADASYWQMGEIVRRPR